MYYSVTTDTRTHTDLWLAERSLDSARQWLAQASTGDIPSALELAFRCLDQATRHLDRLGRLLDQADY